MTSGRDLDGDQPVPPRRRRAPGVAESQLTRRRHHAESNVEYQARRQELIKITANLLRRRAVADISLADVAEAASLDRASIYYYFSSKANLIGEVVRQALAEASARRREMDPALTPAEKLFRWIVVFVEDYDKAFPIHYIYIHEDLDRLPVSSALRDELVATSKRSFEELRDIIEAGMDDGSFRRSLTPGVATQVIIGAVAWLHRWYEPGRSMGPATIGRGIAEVLVHGVAMGLLDPSEA